MAAQQQRRETVQRDRVLAWQVAALSRQRVLPSLSEWIGEIPSGRPQSPQQMRAMLEILADANGWTLRRAKES